MYSSVDGLKLDEVFASRAHAKVLQFLLENPGKAFSLRYLARVTGVAPSTVGIVIDNYEKLGIILLRKLPSVNMIMLNHENPVTQALLQLVERIRPVS
ncbi:MAG: helix-turn-helix domain-containing protein [Candidatus Caldarchaeum sp.]